MKSLTTVEFSRGKLGGRSSKVQAFLPAVARARRPRDSRRDAGATSAMPFLLATRAWKLLPAVLLLAATSTWAQPGEIVLEFTPSHSNVNFTLGASLHSVHGGFDLKRGAIHFNPVTAAVSGEIIVDAASGHSGNNGRDGKMHREILESQRYPEIVFRPDRVEGKVDIQGTSTLQVHGVFTLHGAEHEITIPVQVEIAPGHWNATSHFSIPYVQWGLKNPGTFLLRVSQSVDIDAQASGGSPSSSPAY
jgi:polyisoprenoid-binding protein YceI